MIAVLSTATTDEYERHWAKAADLADDGEGE